jgi:hypothetical protein
MDCEVGIDHHFASGAQAVGSFGRGLKRFGRRGKPLSLSRTGAGQCDGYALAEIPPNSSLKAITYRASLGTLSLRTASTQPAELASAAE